MPSLRVAVFASGTGTNFEALLAASRTGKLDADFVAVISNREEAGVLNLARRSGIPAFHIVREQFGSDGDFIKSILLTLRRYDTNFIVLAGYLKKIPPEIVREFRGRILNIHPALLPAFGGKGMYGRNVHQAVIDYGCKVSGVTVHLVDDEYDNGPPVLQRCVPVLPDDTVECLAERVLEQEHLAYAEALQLFAEDRITLQGRRVIIKP